MCDLQKDASHFWCISGQLTLGPFRNKAKSNTFVTMDWQDTPMKQYFLWQTFFFWKSDFHIVTFCFSVMLNTTWHFNCLLKLLHILEGAVCYYCYSVAWLIHCKSNFLCNYGFKCFGLCLFHISTSKDGKFSPSFFGKPSRLCLIDWKTYGDSKF